MELKDFTKFIEDRCPGAIPLFITLRGSRAYGLDIETSDFDYSGVYYQPLKDLLSTKYKEQVNDDSNDMVFYEIQRFMELLETNNPSMIEMLNTSDDCIIYKHPIMDMIFENRGKYLTKICKNSFTGYVVGQIRKAKGKDKKSNWEKEKYTRKYPMDFCYYHDEEKSMPLKEWLELNEYDQKFCGLSKVPHSKELYAMFYDFKSDELYNVSKHSGLGVYMNLSIDKFNNFLTGKGFKKSVSCRFNGIAFEDSNTIRLSTIPINIPKHYFLGYISFNKDDYSKHCVEYKQYQDWLEKRNDSRWVNTDENGQVLDGKDMMHCTRLLRVSKEIALGKGIIIKRTNDREELLSIRNGKVNLESIILECEKTLLEIDELYKSSNLPEKVDSDWNKNLLLKIRNELYAIS